MSAKFAELGTTVALRRVRGWDAVLTVVESDRGKRITDEVRRIVTTVETNAVKFTPARGRVMVECELVPLSAARGPGAIPLPCPPPRRA